MPSRSQAECDALVVSFHSEGRYGLRVVVHKPNRTASPTPRTGDVPSLWIDVNAESSIIATGREEYCSPGRFLYASPDLDQPADVKQAKQQGFSRHCSYIKRIEADIRVKEEKEPVFTFMRGWTR